MLKMNTTVCYFVFVFTSLLAVNGIGGSEEAVIPKENQRSKFLMISNTSSTEGEGGVVEPERVGIGFGCCEESIIIDQGQTSPMDNGIPTYTVNIENACIGEGCSISDIHLSCGAFTTARMVDPAIFRRLDIDDCLVNDGKPLNPGDVVHFQYADTFPFPLAVKSISC